MANLQIIVASSPITLARFLFALAHCRLYFAFPPFTIATYLFTLALHQVYIAKYRVIDVTFRDNDVSYQ